MNWLLELHLKIIPRYAVIGGHIGFYEILWKLMRYNNRNMHQPLDILREWAKMHLASCIKESNLLFVTVLC